MAMRRVQLIPKNLRPREKLLKYGPEALKLEELLSVIMIAGTKQNPVSRLANKVARLLKRSTVLAKQDLLSLGLGTSKSAQILSALELGKRLAGEDGKLTTLISPKQAFAQSYEIINSQKETLLCFYLNARGELLKKEVVAVGSLNRANVLPREIFSFVKDAPVASIILVHNHPSGNLEPSRDDEVFTKRVKLAGEILGVTLLDHLIVSAKGWKRIKF